LIAAASTAKSHSPQDYTPKHLADRILTSKAALEGERKQVTVLFADLKGSMELLADRDPEEARKILDPVLELMMEAVHRYEGTVNQVMGDGIMALFGAPIAHEDHAARACYAALRMQESVRHYAESVRRTTGIPIQIRVGLNSGEVVVREIGSDLRMDYSAVGQTVHLASRMEQMAAPGTILVTTDALTLAEGYVETKSLGALPVKGLEAPVEVYEVTAASAARSRLQAAAARRGLSRFVGRDAELVQLRRALEQVAAGHGQVVAVLGGPGVGKSRLAWELTRRQRTAGWTVMEAGSVSYGRTTSYLPVIELLRASCRIEARDDARVVREKLIGRVLGLDRTLDSTLPAFLSLLDLDPEDDVWRAMDGSQRRRRTLEALKHLVVRESQVQPLLLVFEDLHWIDEATQALLDSLVESLPATRILLLVNYRPEYRHQWASRSYYTQIQLDALPPESVDELLHALLGEDRSLQRLKVQLVDRTGGNPFFVEECVRALIETGALAGGPGAYRLTRDLAEIRIPGTVQSVLAARIDRLPAEDKRLLQVAAVIGKDVPSALLETVASPEGLDLRRCLAHLQEAELVYEAHLFPEPEYTFKHALTHEVAYGSLLQERRRALHGRIVSALERLHAGNLVEQVERLAHHAVRGASWEQALTYCTAAGAKAMGRSVYREATEWHEQALQALTHLPETRDRLEQSVDLRLLLRNSLQPDGELQRLLDHLSKAEAVLERLGDQRRQSWLWGCQAACCWLLGEHERGIEAGHRAVGAAVAVGDPHLIVAARWNLSLVYWGHGDYRRGVDCVLENHAALEAGALSGVDLSITYGGTTHPAVGNPGNAAWYLAELGEFTRAEALGQEAVRKGEALQHLYSLTLALFHLGGAYVRWGDVPRAVAALERSRQLAETEDYRFYVPWASARLGAAYLLAGRVEESLALLRRTVEVDAARTAQAEVSLWCGWLAEAYLASGQPAEADALAGRALDLAISHGERGNQGWALRLHAVLATRRAVPDLDAAKTFYQQALVLADELGMRPLVAHCHTGLAKLDRRTGNRKHADEHFTIATTMYRDMDMRFWLQQAETEAATG
jgi:class 3 adenylate cyclase/tetratricopeptide (TPR) repeat protein